MAVLWLERMHSTTEVQGISFVGYTGDEGSKSRLWNLQNLCPVPPYTASFAKFSRIKRYRGKILAVTDVLVQVCAENLKCKFLYRYMSCPQTFAKIPTDQRELCERGCTRTYHAFCSDLWLGRYIFTSHNTATIHGGC